VRYGTRIEDPISFASPLQKGSSDTRYPITNYVTCANFSTSYQQYLATITKIVKPRFYHEAIKDAQWQNAMVKEIEAIEDNATWDIVDLPLGKKPSSCKWVYHVKYNSNGTV